jgi:hypothetical protein
VVEKPKEAIVVADGLFKEARLTLVGRLNGFDLRLQVPTGALIDDKTIPSLGGFKSLCGEFSSSASAVLTAGVPAGVNRIAFGAVIHFTATNRLEAYRQLASYLRGSIAGPENLYDLLYRCNRRKDSSVLGMDAYVNRLSTWMVANVQMVRDTISGAQLSHEVTKTAWIVQLELDINTPADRVDPLPSDKLVDVFGELMDMGREIALEGDIP